jgi:dihydroorotate dehydrogenase
VATTATDLIGPEKPDCFWASIRRRIRRRSPWQEPALISLFDRLARPLLLALDAEDAHALTVRALKYAPLPRPVPDDPALAVRAFGLSFPNPVGMAAGFDKNGDVPDALLRLGFGFVEVGTVTPKPQSGNPRPRLFRLPADQGIINRFGFNGDGEARVLARLAARAARGGIVGVNVGANKASEDRGADYVRLIEVFAPVASYFCVNISSPNTPGLRELQQAAALDDLLARVVAARERVALTAGTTPVLVKIAPDLTLAELDDVVAIARRRRVDGMIVGNTTIKRPKWLQEAATARETGGLSGRPLFHLATRMLAETFVRVESQFPLIGVGGIDSGETAVAKLRAGASLIQLYSSLVFKGLGLVADIKAALLAALTDGRAASLEDLVGTDAAEMTAQDWPVY